MEATFKYAIVLASGLAIGFVALGRPNLVGPAEVAWFDDIRIRLEKVFAPAMRGADVLLVDQSRAASVDEELDYRIAERLGTLEGWRAFLAAHGGGPYVQAAKGEIERLLLAPKPLTPGVAQAFVTVSEDGQPSIEAAPAAEPSAELEAAAQPPGLVSEPSASIDAAPMETPPSQESGVLNASLSSEAMSTAERGGPAPPARHNEVAEVAAPDVMKDTTATDAAPSQTAGPASSSGKAEAPAVPAPRAAAHRRGHSRAIVSRDDPPRRHATRCRHGCAFRPPPLPPILLALLGQRPGRLGASSHGPHGARPVGFSWR